MIFWINQKDEYGQIVLHHAVVYCQSENEIPGLMCNRLSVCANIQDNMLQTSLMVVLLNDKIHIINELLKYNLAMLGGDNSQQTVLMYAAHGGVLEPFINLLDTPCYE